MAFFTSLAISSVSSVIWRAVCSGAAPRPAARHLRDRRLVLVLPQWETPEADIHAVYPQRLQLSSRVRAFVQFMAEALATGPELSN